MNEQRLPRKMWAWFPRGRRRKGRLCNSWMQEITTEMRENGINNKEWIDREEWRRKTLNTERCENIETLYINKIIIIIIIIITILRIQNLSEPALSAPVMWIAQPTKVDRIRLEILSYLTL